MFAEKNLQTYPIDVRYYIICGCVIKDEYIDDFGNIYNEPFCYDLSGGGRMNEKGYNISFSRVGVSCTGARFRAFSYTKGQQPLPGGIL